MPIPVETLLANVDAMRRLARSVVHDAATADDVTQAAVLTALRKPPRDQRNVRGWLFRVVRNTARDARRTQRRQVARDQAAARPEAAPSQSAIVDGVRAQRDLLNAVMALPETYREVVWLRTFEDLPVRKVAERLSIPAETVRTRYRRAVERLRVQLDEQHNGSRHRWMAALLPVAGRFKPAPWIWGSVMGSQTKAIALAAIVLLALAAGWFIWSPGDSISPDSQEQAVASEDVSGPTLHGVEGVPVEATPVEPVTDEGDVVRGTVRDGAGGVVAGCDLLVGPTGTMDVDELSAVAKSDPAGLYTLPWQELSGGMRIVARAKGRRTDVRILSSLPKASVDFVLPRTRELVFVIRDGETDKPIADAVATTHVMRGLRQVTVSIRADPTGRIIVTDPRRNAVDTLFPLRFDAPGYQPKSDLDRQYLGHNAATADNPREVYLFRGEGLRLKVVDSDGNPVAGAQVEAWTGGRGMGIADPKLDTGALQAIPYADQTTSLGVATSDGNGEVVLATAAPGERWHARALSPGAVALAFGLIRHSRPRPGRAQRAEGLLQLVPAGDVSVEVVDESGAPVARAAVDCRPSLWVETMRKGRMPTPPASLQRSMMGLTDQTGRITFKGAQKSSFVGAHRMDVGMGRGDEQIEFGPDSVAQVRIVLKPFGSSAQIRVVDAGGAPIAGALVFLKGHATGVLTDEDGDAKLIGIPAPAHSQGQFLVATKDGYARTMVPLATDEETRRLVLGPSTTLSGRVVTPDGVGTDAIIDFYRGEVATLSEEERKRRARLFQPDWIRRIHTDRSGRFHVDDLPPGPWYVNAFVDFTRTRHELVAPPEEGGEVILTLPAPESPAPTGSVDGAVRDADGQVLTNYWTTLRGKVGERQRGFSPVMKGRRFLYDAIPEGAYTLTTTSGDGKRKVEQPVDVASGQRVDVDVMLAESYSLSARILKPDGAPLRGATVFILRGREKTLGSRQTKTGDEGWVEYKHLLPDQYRLELKAGDVAYRLADAVVPVGPEATPAPTFHSVLAARVILDFDDDRFMVPGEDRKPTRNHAWFRTYGTRLYLTDPAGKTREDWGLFHGRRATSWGVLPGRYHFRIDGGPDEGRFETDIVVRGTEDVVVRVTLRK